VHVPGAAAPHDERERRQLRATYYGAQREVDDQLARLFSYLAETGLVRDTLVVVTSDHGEQGGDHWLLEKLGYWDESYHVPLIVRDPRPAADGGRGAVVGEFTESVDVLPTVCQWMGVDVPRQADGCSLAPFLSGEGPPPRWRAAAHFEWHFSDPRHRLAEEHLGLPAAHCALLVERSRTAKYVQFAADPAVLPPLLFDLVADPSQVEDRAKDPGWAEEGWRAAQSLLAWRLRHDERTLSGQLLTRDKGLVSADDGWR
jgi:arylsulfatase A-like enzyme